MAKQGTPEDNAADVSHRTDPRAPLDTASPEETRTAGKCRIHGDPDAMRAPDGAESQPKLFDGEEPDEGS